MQEGVFCLHSLTDSSHTVLSSTEFGKWFTPHPQLHTWSKLLKSPLKPKKILTREQRTRAKNYMALFHIGSQSFRGVLKRMPGGFYFTFITWVSFHTVKHQILHYQLIQDCALFPDNIVLPSLKAFLENFSCFVSGWFFVLNKILCNYTEINNPEYTKAHSLSKQRNVHFIFFTLLSFAPSERKQDLLDFIPKCILRALKQ